MSDLISRQAVLNFTTTVTASEDAHKVLESFLGEFVAYVESLPSVQPERKTGHWIIAQDKDGNTYGECSSCGMKQYAGTLRYCPYCGAEAEGDPDAESN